MSNEQSIFSSDLAGVIVGETAISDVRGDVGSLSYRGIEITELVDKPFTQVVWLVLFGHWPSAQQEQDLASLLADQSQLSDRELAMLRQIPRDLHPMLMLCKKKATFT